jgi:hypothetical protein
VPPCVMSAVINRQVFFISRCSLLYTAESFSEFRLFHILDTTDKNRAPVYDDLVCADILDKFPSVPYCSV